MRNHRHSQALLLLVLFCIAPAHPQTGDFATVIAKPISRIIDLPGEFTPYMSVALHAKIRGFVERVNVDVGSMVKKGQTLIELSAPEMAAQIAEAESKVRLAESDRIQAEAQLAAAQATYGRLKKASETPGAIAGNELIQAEKQVDAANAAVAAREQAGRAAQSAVEAQRDLLAYLKITAPFDGVITERLAHPGALAGPGADPVLLVVQQVSRLRLIVPVPEEDIGGMTNGATVTFHVPAYPERTYTGTIARNGHFLDPNTRTTPIELDVYNRDGSLSPGMFPAVKWLVRRARQALFVPKTAVVNTTERTFVIRDRAGNAEWVDVKEGIGDGDFVEVSGDLHAGDRVIRRGTDELQNGAHIPAKQ
jgi:membrane fusion protein (multidrug efflux system)